MSLLNTVPSNTGFDHINYQKNRIFTLLDSIEQKVGKMAHEIDEVRHQLKKWQDGNLANSFFINHLTKFVDQLNSGVAHD